jgi:hypothetical protein
MSNVFSRLVLIFLLQIGYLESKGFEFMFERAEKWVSLVLTPEEIAAPEVQQMVWPEGLETSRIIIKDAERTFMAEDDRQKIAKFLTVVEHKFGDYAQGSFAHRARVSYVSNGF